MQQKNKYIRIQEFLKQNKFPNYRMKQITNAIFPGRINNFNEITVLPKSLRDMLIEEFGESILNIVPLKAQQSTKSTTIYTSFKSLIWNFRRRKNRNGKYEI